MKQKLEDIARKTGYSITTVSRALNGSSSISEKTRLLVLETARKTGYLQSGKTIALVVPRIDLAYYYKDMIERLGSIIQFSGFRMELIPLHYLELIEEHNPSAVLSLVGEDGLERYWGKKYKIPLISLLTSNNQLYPDIVLLFTPYRFRRYQPTKYYCQLHTPLTF